MYLWNSSIGAFKVVNLSSVTSNEQVDKGKPVKPKKVLSIFW